VSGSSTALPERLIATVKSLRISRGVFIFAGGTASTYQTFWNAAGVSDKDKKDRILAKVPDFYTRLDAYYNVLGPNPRMRTKNRAITTDAQLNELEPDPEDLGYPLRRALFIRNQLRCGAEDRLDFGSDLLDALLLVPRYNNGARSLEKVIQSLRRDNGEPIRRSSLPGPAQLSMHVDVEAFTRILNRNAEFRMDDKIEQLAEEIHTAWRDREHAAGRTPPEFDDDYKKLAEVAKEDNRAAARRIPEVLAFADIGIIQDEVAEGPTDEQVRDHIEHHLERLAEAEHDGWVEQRVRNGWVYAKVRDDTLRHHPMIIEYERLPRENKDKDRNSVINYLERLHNTKYCIVWLDKIK
jgi:hypothetical protein